jgi:hypothetical protein
MTVGLSNAYILTTILMVLIYIIGKALYHKIKNFKIMNFNAREFVVLDKPNNT